MKAIEEFNQRKTEFIAKGATDKKFIKATRQWLELANHYEYSYHFSWLSRPIIQYPQDIVALQELVWQVKPDMIIETGIAHGGSLVLSASLLALIDYSEAVEAGVALNPKIARRRVLGIDIDIREHNRIAIEAHPMSHRIDMIEGSSISPELISKVHEHVQGKEKIVVILDSNHTHEHTLAELTAYAPLVSVNSYCVVFDTIIDDFSSDFFPDRPWGRGNNPKTAVIEYLKDHPEFEIDKTIPDKLMITVSRDGYLKRIR